MAKVNEQDDYDPSADEGIEDFSYDEASYDEGSLDNDMPQDEVWDENYEEDGQEDAGGDDQPAPKKKKGGLFNVILILAVALGGGGFMYLKFAGGPGVPSSSPASVTEPSVVENAPPQNQAPAASMAESAPAIEQAAVDGPLLPEPGDSGAVLTETASPLEESPLALVQDESPLEALSGSAGQLPVEVASEPPMPAPISGLPDNSSATANAFKPSLPSAQDIMLTKPVVQGGAAPLADVTKEVLVKDAVVSDSNAGLKSVDQKLSVLLARMDSFEGRIANLETGLHQMSSKVAGGSDPAQALTSMKETLAALEDKVNELNAGVVTEKSAPAPVLAVKAAVEEPVFVPAVPVAAGPNSVETSGKNLPRVRGSEKPVVTERALAPKAENWVLRSAQPGTAMVASKASGDMRSVKVGDVLPGIGKIISIEIRNGRWVVQGTTSSLTH